jgi:hypothetical protein
VGVKQRTAPSDQPDALSARQRERRLRERIRPKEPAATNADPWQIADEALDLLDTTRLRLVRLKMSIDDIDEVAELLRRLAWGPED